MNAGVASDIRIRTTSRRPAVGRVTLRGFTRCQRKKSVGGLLAQPKGRAFILKTRTRNRLLFRSVLNLGCNTSTSKSIAMKVRLLRHTAAPAVPDNGSFEVRFPDGRPSRY